VSDAGEVFKAVPFASLKVTGPTLMSETELPEEQPETAKRPIVNRATPAERSKWDVYDKGE
jgi:hypothetical protein